MQIIQSRLFEQRVKRFNKARKLILDEQIRLIVKNPAIGNQKNGDLKEVFVHKFRIQEDQYLLAYRLKEESLQLLMIGPHQNYYRDLKKYLKKS